MNNIFFFQTQQILDSSIFNQLKEQNIFYSYFQVDQNYYLFVYAQNSIDINFLYQLIDVIQELDSKQRKLRSFRGFFLYALEIIQNADNYESLKTNLQPFFWRKVRNIIRQNKKGALQEFLFGSTYGREEVYTILDTSSSPALQELQNQIQSLHNKVDSLQQKVIQLEYKLENPKYPAKARRQQSRLRLSESSQPLESSKTTQQGNYTLNSNMGSLPKKSFQENDTNFHQAQEASFKSSSETSKIDFKPLSDSQQYNLILESRKRA